MEIGHSNKERAVRRERMRAFAMAQLRLEQARASVGRTALGCTHDEVESGRLAVAKMLRENAIPASELMRLSQAELELLLDAFLEHERAIDALVR